LQQSLITSARSFSSLSLSTAAWRSCSEVTLAAFFIRRKSAVLMTNVCPEGSSRGTLAVNQNTDLSARSCNWISNL